MNGQRLNKSLFTFIAQKLTSTTEISVAPFVLKEQFPYSVK